MSLAFKRNTVFVIRRSQTVLALSLASNLKQILLPSLSLSISPMK